MIWDRYTEKSSFRFPTFGDDGDLVGPTSSTIPEVAVISLNTPKPKTYLYSSCTWCSNTYTRHPLAVIFVLYFDHHQNSLFFFYIQVKYIYIYRVRERMKHQFTVSCLSPIQYTKISHLSLHTYVLI